MKKIIMYIVIGSAIILMLSVACIAFDIYQYGNTDEKASADVIIVLGAGLANGKPTPVFTERINHAVWLYTNGYANKIIFTGGTGDGNNCSDAFAAGVLAFQAGVPTDAVFLEEASTITEENLLYAKDIMDDMNLKTAIIVSDPLHMKRAMTMASDYKITAYSSPTPTTMYRSFWAKAGFLVRELFFYTGYLILH